MIYPFLSFQSPSLSLSFFLCKSMKRICAFSLFLLLISVYSFNAAESFCHDDSSVAAESFCHDDSSVAPDTVFGVLPEVTKDITDPGPVIASRIYADDNQCVAPDTVFGVLPEVSKDIRDPGPVIASRIYADDNQCFAIPITDTDAVPCLPMVTSGGPGHQPWWQMMVAGLVSAWQVGAELVNRFRRRRPRQPPRQISFPRRSNSLTSEDKAKLTLNRLKLGSRPPPD